MWLARLHIRAFTIFLHKLADGEDVPSVKECARAASVHRSTLGRYYDRVLDCLAAHTDYVNNHMVLGGPADSADQLRSAAISASERTPQPPPTPTGSTPKHPDDDPAIAPNTPPQQPEARTPPAIPDSFDVQGGKDGLLGFGDDLLDLVIRLHGGRGGSEGHFLC